MNDDWFLIADYEVDMDCLDVYTVTTLGTPIRQLLGYDCELALIGDRLYMHWLRGAYDCDTGKGGSGEPPAWFVVEARGANYHLLVASQGIKTSSFHCLTPTRSRQQ